MYFTIRFMIFAILVYPHMSQIFLKVQASQDIENTSYIVILLEFVLRTRLSL